MRARVRNERPGGGWRVTAITSEMPVFSPWPRTGPFQVLAWISPLVLISPEKTFLGRCEGRKRESRGIAWK